MPRLSGLPQPRRQLPLLSDWGETWGETGLRVASPFGGTSLGWEAELDDGPHDARSAVGEGEGSLSLVRVRVRVSLPLPLPLTPPLPLTRARERARSPSRFGRGR